MPGSGSQGEDELLEATRRYRTLESPFDREYLLGLLPHNGFAVIGDYVSVSGLFDRADIEGDRIPVDMLSGNYLLCKKVAEGSAATVPDSRQPGFLAARLSLRSAWPGRTTPGAPVRAEILIENVGDTLWLAGRATHLGSVTIGVKLLDQGGTVLDEVHGDPPLRAMAPGERVTVTLERRAPSRPGDYLLKLDLVDQHVAWFEERGIPAAHPAPPGRARAVSDAPEPRPARARRHLTRRAGSLLPVASRASGGLSRSSGVRSGQTARA